MSDAICTVVPRPDIGILVVRWAADAPATQLQQHYHAILAAAQEAQLHRWLLDVRRRDQLDPEIGHWTTHVFYPQAAAVLHPTSLRIAVLCSPVRLAVYEANPEQQEYLGYGLASERPYQLRLFIDEGPAMQWLLA